MSEFKGTPGPWFMEDGKDDGWIIADGDNLVCMMHAGLTHEEMSYSERHDANLIMAAPDLLEAQTMGAQLNTPDFLDWIAERLVNVYGESPHVDFVLSLKDRAAAGRAAIAKALGETK